MYLKKLLLWRLKYFNEDSFLLVISGFVGIIAGLAAVILKTTVHLIQEYLKILIGVLEKDYLIMILPLIGIIITIIISRFILNDKLGHGITLVIYSISKNSGIIRKTVMYSRMVTSAITVGFGGSVGLEAPIVVTGSAFGSNIGSLFNFDYKKRTLLIGCGAAGAISAIFNSPIAGVIFAIEVLLTDITISKFIPILIASVFGQLVSMVLTEGDFLFAFKLLDKFKADETHYYMILGLFCGISSLYFTRVMYQVEKRVKMQTNKIIRGLQGGLGIAIIIFFLPALYGEGYNTIIDLLNNNEYQIIQFSFFDLEFIDKNILLIFSLVLILIIKPVATALTIGSGGSGGIFAPSLFMGGVTGFLTAYILNFFLPNLDLSLSNFTLVGMGGVMSGVLHAPLTGIFLIAEITGGYDLFVPLMFVSAISYTTITNFEKHSIYTKNLVERGDFIPYDKDKLVLNLITLNKIVEKDILTVRPDETLGQLIDVVKKSKRNIFAVVNHENKLKGIITLDDIREIMFDFEKKDSLLVSNLMTKPPAFVEIEEEMNEVMNKFETTQAWNLPVLSKEGQYIGFISKSSIFNVYRSRLIDYSKE